VERVSERLLTPRTSSAAVQEESPPSDAGGRHWRTVLRRLLRPVAIFAASRVAVLVSMWLAVRLAPGMPASHVFLAWDGSLYYKIIVEGYSRTPSDPGIYAFFPAFPLSSRLLASLPGIGPLAAGLIVSVIASFGAAIAIWMLADHLMGPEAADRAVALFAFFPGSFVLSMLYSEGVMLALAAGCLWALVRHKWLLAGILAALGTASRPNAIALIAACAWAAGAAILSRREWRSLIAPALAPLGIAGFFALLWSRTGDPTTWFRVQRELWHERVTPLALVNDVRDFVTDPFGNTNTTAALFGAVVCAIGLVLLVRSRLPSVLTVYTAVVVALAACSETLGARPRFVLTAFPLFFAFALRVRGMTFSAAVAVSATVLGALTLMSLDTLLFTP
jgi:hypothetical protein